MNHVRDNSKTLPPRKRDAQERDPQSSSNTLKDSLRGTSFDEGEARLAPKGKAPETISGGRSGIVGQNDQAQSSQGAPQSSPVSQPQAQNAPLTVKERGDLETKLANLTPSHRAQIIKVIEAKPKDARDATLDAILRGEGAWQNLEQGGDDIFAKLMMYVTGSSVVGVGANYDKKGRVKEIRHPNLDADMGRGYFDPTWEATSDWQNEQLRDESRSRGLYGTTAGEMQSAGQSPTNTGHDEALSYVQARAQKGALRAEYGVDSLQGALRFLSGTKGTLDELVAQLQAQEGKLDTLGPEKKDHKQDKDAKKLKAWRWENLADLKGDASGTEMLQAALLRLQARREVLDREVTLLSETLAARKTRDSVPKADRDTARRTGRSLANLPKEQRKLAKFDRHEVGSESVSGHVGASAGVGVTDHLSAGGGVSIGGSKNRNVQDDRRYREQKTVAIGVSAGLGHKTGGGGDSDPVDVASTGASASYSHSRTATYQGTAHKAARETTSSVLPGESRKNRDALLEFQGWLDQGGQSPIGNQATPAIMPELREAMEVVNELAQLSPGHVATNTLSGNVSVGDAMVGAEASASVSRSHQTFSKGKSKDGNKQKRKGSTTTGSFAVTVGGFTVTATLADIVNNANPDNDGLYLTLDFSVARAISLPLADPGALINTVGACIGDALSNSKTGESTASGKPSEGWKKWLTPAKMALEAGLNIGLNQAVGALPSMAMAASPISIHFATGKSFTLNFVRSTGAWALQYTRLTNSISAGVSGSGQAGPAPVTVSAGVSYDKSMMQGETLGADTLTYAQTVYNGHKNQNTSKVKRGDERWAKFAQDHDDELTKMRNNIAMTAPKSKVRKELEAVLGDLTSKQDSLAADPVTLKAALGANGTKIDTLDTHLTQTVTSLNGLLQASPPSQQQLDDYMEKSRLMAATIQGLSPDVNRAQKNAPDPLLKDFAKTFFGGTGKKHGWVDG